MSGMTTFFFLFVKSLEGKSGHFNHPWSLCGYVRVNMLTLSRIIITFVGLNGQHTEMVLDRNYGLKHSMLLGLLNCIFF